MSAIIARPEEYNTVHWYYDLTDPKQHSGDPEGTLVQYCDAHAQPFIDKGEIQKAQNGDQDTVCELCMETNYADRHAAMDAEDRERFGNDDAVPA